MRIRLPVVVSAVIGSLVLANAPARADDASTALEELKQGYALKQDGKCEEAVPVFEHSASLDPKPKTLLNLAACEANLGDLVAAQRDAVRGRDLATAAQDQELATVASTQLAAIEKRLAHLTVVLAHGAPPDSAVSRDRLPMGASTLGTEVALNAGPHVITVVAKGRAERRFDVFLSEGANAQIEVAPGDRVAAVAWSPAPQPIAAPVAAAEPEPEPEAPASASATPTEKLLAYGAFALGAVGLTVGIATGIVATSQHGTLVSDCNGYDCGAAVQGTLNSFRALRTWSTVGYVVGVVGAAGGAVLWFNAPTAPPDSPAASLWLGPGSAGVGGRF
jgi:hypothetical protein